MIFLYLYLAIRGIYMPNDYCRSREAFEFGSTVKRERIVLECCKDPEAFAEISEHYKINIDQEMYFPYDGLIAEMMEGGHKANGQKIIAIPVPNPDKYCQNCDFYLK